MQEFYGSIRTMIGNNTFIKLKQWFKRLLQRWMPLLVVRQNESGISVELLTAHGYEPASIDHLPEMTPFAQTIALIDDQCCAFRLCYFPVDMVDFTDLNEAIELDMSEWSPFEDGHSLSFIERDGDQWSVSVWVWAKSVEHELLVLMPRGLTCTHVLPESAWYVAQAKVSAASLLICNFIAQSRYFLLSSSGFPQGSVVTNDAMVAKRFWRSLGGEREHIQHVLTVNAKQCWSPESRDIVEVEVLRPRSALLSRARLQGVKDWVDPSSWRKPLLAVISICIVWIASDAAVLQYQSDQQHKQLAAMKDSAHLVLKQRDDVERMHTRLQRVQTLRQAQGRPILC